jgi:hypothetical protein
MYGKTRYILPIRVFKTADEAMHQHSTADPGLILTLIRDLKYIIRLRKMQAAYHERRPDKTEEQAEECITHAYFISILSDVLTLILELRLRRIVEEMTLDSSHVADTNAEDSAALVSSAHNFREKIEEGKAAPTKDPMLRQIVGDLGAEYAFLVALYRIDVEAIRAQCQELWTLHKKDKLTAQTAAVPTNAPFHFIKSRTAELLLETEDIREEFTDDTPDVLIDSDPLWHLWGDFMTQLQAHDPRAVAMLRGDSAEDISEQAENCINAHFGLAIDALIQHWRNAKESPNASTYLCAQPTLLQPPQELEDSFSRVHVLAYKEEATTFFIREFVRSGKLVAEEEATSLGCFDELTTSCRRSFSKDSLDHWQPLGLEILTDAVVTLSADLEQPSLEYRTERDRRVEELEPRPDNTEEENDQASRIRTRLQPSERDSLPDAASKFQNRANRKAKKRGKVAAPHPLGTKMHEHFLSNHNPVLSRCRAWEQDTTTQEHHMNIANSSKIIHEMTQIHNALWTEGFLEGPRYDSWFDVWFLEQYFEDNFYFLGADRPLNLAEASRRFEILQERSDLGDYTFAILQLSETFLQLLNRTSDPTTIFRSLQKQLLVCCQGDDDVEDEIDGASIVIVEDDNVAKLSSTHPRKTCQHLYNNNISVQATAARRSAFLLLTRLLAAIFVAFVATWVNFGSVVWRRERLISAATPHPYLSRSCEGYFTASSENRTWVYSTSQR